MERLTIAEFLDHVALGVGDREALVFPDERVRWSYRDTHARATQVAKGLMGLGVDPGDHVAVFATERPEWVLLQYAVAKVGAVLVPIDPASGGRDLGYVLAHSDASTLFVLDRTEGVSLLDVVAECCPEVRTGRPGRMASRALPRLKRVVAFGDAAAHPSGAVLGWTDLLRAGAGITDHLLRRRQEGAEPTDLAALHYTSGTTGAAKGVELTHVSLVNNAIAAGDCMRLRARDRVCAPVPFARPLGSVVGTLGTLGRGATHVVPAEHFDPAKTHAAIAAERCTALHGEPRMLVSMIRSPELLRTDLSSLRTGLVSGGACPADVMRELMERLHLREGTVGYGETEATAIVTQTRTDDGIDLRANTVGRALPDVEVTIVDPKSGTELPRGQEGELCCRGSLVMRGYYKDPDGTAAKIGRNGWLRTGDLAVMDQYGYCAITGRVS
jgi:fatty-acyl-CoA synthase